MKTSEPSNNGNKPASDQSGNGQAAHASRSRFERYRQLVKRKEVPSGSFHSASDRAPKSRGRTAGQLVLQFFGLLRPSRVQLFWVLVSPTAATLIGLIPPAGTKFVIDY